MHKLEIVSQNVRTHACNGASVEDVQAVLYSVRYCMIKRVVMGEM
jgi:hypothetical protein